MSVTTGKLVFDTTTALDENSNVGAFLRDAAGSLITSTLVGAAQSLDVHVTRSSGQYAEDSAHTTGDMGNLGLAVRRDANTSLVDADGDYAPLQVDALGRLKVAADIDIVSGFEKLEDAPHASGDVGAYVLSVREDILASSTSATGDYQSLKTDSLGSLWVRQSAATASPNIAILATAIVASNVAILLPAVALASRKKITIMNNSTKTIFLGSSAVTVASGAPLASGASITFELGAGVDVYGIAAAVGTNNIRVIEVA